MSPLLKRCAKCGQEKPATGDYFQPSSKYRDRLTSECRMCRRAAMKAYHRDHPNKVAHL